MNKAKEEYYKIFTNGFDFGGYAEEGIVANYINELEKQNEELIKLLKYCCYEEDFNSDFLIHRLKCITGKSIEEVLKDE